MALILIIDDDQEVREMICTGLESEGHEVLQADTLAKGKELLKKDLPDLILQDLIMPDGDGLEFITQLLAHEKTQTIPIIVVSAMRQKKKIVEGLKAGAVDYITKPFDVVELRVRVIAALKIHDLKQVQAQNRDLEAMRETAKTIAYEIELPMQEIQRCLIQLRNEAEDFREQDQMVLDEARGLFAQLETVLSKAQHQ